MTGKAALTSAAEAQPSNAVCEMTGEANTLAPVVFLSALCSMIYELCFAHILSSFLGHTTLQYSLVIGLYVFFLGVGALSTGTQESANQIWNVFFKVEISIIISAIIGYFFCFLTIFLIDSWHLPGIFKAFIYVPVVAIGFLSGMELPLLFGVSQHNLGKSNESVVLFWDYIASFVATLIFPFVFLAYIGIFQSLIITCFLNAVLAAYALKFAKFTTDFYKNLVLTLGFVLVSMVFLGNQIQSLLTSWVY